MTSSPDEDIVNTSQIAAGVYRSLANAILDPSGDQTGDQSQAELKVSCQTPEPSVFIEKMSRYP